MVDIYIYILFTFFKKKQNRGWNIKMHTISLNDEQYKYIQGLIEAGIDAYDDALDYIDENDAIREEATLRSLCDLFNIEF